MSRNPDVPGVDLIGLSKTRPGSTTVDTRAIDRVRRLLLHLHAGGTPGGGVIVEWDLGGLTVSFDVDADGEVRLL